MTNKVCVVGGLGYLGSILSNELTNSGVDVTVVDSCLFDNENVKDEIRFNTLRKENVTKIETEWFEQFDDVIWCADIDAYGWYVEELLAEHIAQKISKFNEIVECTRVHHIRNYALDVFDRNEGIKEGYFNYIDQMNCENVIHVGSMFGPSPRMRWDTYVNMLLFTFVTQEEIQLMGNWLQQFPITSVLNAAIKIIKYVSSGEKYENVKLYDMYVDVVQLVHLVEYFGEFKNPIKVSPNYSKPNLDNITRINTDEDSSVIQHLKAAIEALLKGLERNDLPDFMKDKYNNEIYIDKMLTGMKIVKSLYD